MSMTQAVSRAVTPNDTTPAPHYCAIPVINGPDALCDEEDFAFLSLFNWRAHGTPPTSYPTLKLNGAEFHMHQLVVREEKKFKVNHRDGNPFNNCRANLRLASNQQIAAANPKSSKRLFSSRYKGVSWAKRDQKWKAYIAVAGVKHWLGYFCDEEKAARAYDAAAYAAFGEFAYLNFAPNTTIAERPRLNDERAYRTVETLGQPSGPQTIPVVNGPFALCDPQDFLLTSHFNWYAEYVGSLRCSVTHLCGHTIPMHDLVLRSTGQRRVTHRDGNAFNNCHENLRTPQSSRILAYKTRAYKTTKPRSSSRYKGVWKRLIGGKWTSTIIVKGTPRHLGSFPNEEDAARAYDKAAREVFGRFAYLNFPEQQSQIRS